MTKNNRKEYNAPMVEVLAARVERGFEMSGNNDLLRDGNMEGVGNSNNNYDNALFS